MPIGSKLFTLAALVLLGCGCGKQRPAQSPLVADGKPAITVHFEPTFTYVTSRESGVRIIPGIDIYSGGGCVIRRDDGTESERRISQQQLATLLRFFEAERVLGLTDAAVDEAKARESGGRGGRWTHDVYTRLIIRQPNTLTHVSRYGLLNEIKWHPNCRELRAIQRCVEKVYETVGEGAFAAR